MEVTNDVDYNVVKSFSDSVTQLNDETSRAELICRYILFY